MSYLAVTELETGVPISQKIRVSKSCNIEIIRLNLCKIGILTNGTLTLQVLRDGNIIGEKSIQCSSLDAIASHFHGMISFDLEETIAVRKLPEDEYIELEILVTLDTSSESSLSLIKTSNPTTEYYNSEIIPENLQPDELIWYLPYGLEIFTN